MLVFFTNLSCMLFQVRYLVLFLLLSVRDSFKWFWMSLRKNIQLMLDFPKSQFLVLHFSCYTLMTFLMVLSVMLLSMLMILLSIPSVIRRLICSNNLKWLLNLILIYKILWTGARSDMLISMLGKVNWFGLTGLITLVLLLWKWMSLLLRKSHLLRCWGWPSLLNWIGALTTKTASNNIGALIRSMKFLSLQRFLWFSINQSYVNVWNTIVKSGLVPLVASWNCYSSYKNEYAGLLVLYLLLFLNRWPILKMWPAWVLLS